MTLYATKKDLEYLQTLAMSPSVGPPLERESLTRCARTVARVLLREADDTKEIPIEVERGR